VIVVERPQVPSPEIIGGLDGLAGVEGRSDDKCGRRRGAEGVRIGAPFRRPPVECYRAGVEAWRRQHPDQSAEYAAKQVVAVILATHVKIRIEE
jgi:hypothetical protein